MNARHFAWLYLVKNGSTGYTPSYYGGMEEDLNTQELLKQNPHMNSLSWLDRSDAVRSMFIAKIKDIGVDWGATKSPASDIQYEFQGTDQPAGRTEIIVGELVLNDGQIQKWIAYAISAANVFDMMENIYSAKTDFKEIFGEINV